MICQLVRLSAACAAISRADCSSVSTAAALAAAAALSTSDILPAKDDSSKRNFKVLQSLNMRAYGADEGDTVSCQAGSMDLMLGANARGGEAIRSGGGVDGLDDFWSMAREAQAQLKSFVDKGYPKDAVGVFDWMMKVSELTNLVHLEVGGSGVCGWMGGWGGGSMDGVVARWVGGFTGG